MKKSKKIILIIVCILLAIIILLGSAFFLLRYLGKKKFHKEDKNITNSSVTVEDEDYIEYNGGKYKLNKNIVTILFMGIDKQNIENNKGSGANGQADCIFLAVIDTEKKQYKVIPISRETLVDVDIYTTSGNFSKTEHEQICVSYSYGTTPEKSCENVLTSLRRMFYGLNINSYIALDLKGLEKLSTIVGGVPVKSTETFKNNYCFEEGVQYNLSGDQAVSYIRWRGQDIESNNRRMLREKQFFTSLVSKIGNVVVKDFSKLGTIYSEMMPYASTNVDLSMITYLASTCLTPDMGSRIEYLKIDGTTTKSDHYYFNIDEESFLQLVVDTFYVKVK